MLPPRLTFAAAILACAALLGVAACSSGKPAKKGRTVLVTEYHDAKVGRESVAAVAAQMGIMEDEALNAYVSEIGHKLLRGIPRLGFDYQFHVVDQVEPNAFALPGGYIFISRGLLALANNEDELACVVGHEITHAAHRHSAAQQGIAERGNPLSMGWRAAARMAAYGRDMERDADEGGQLLCAAAGYDPMGMSTFLATLGQTERLRLGYTRGPSFFDTHPGSRERAAENAVRASEIRWTRDPEIGDPREALFARIDGLPVGQRPEAGIFVGDSFLHPDLDFHVRFPPGWAKSNAPTAVGAQAPDGRAVVFLTADSPAGNPQEVAEAWIEKAKTEQKLDVQESKPVRIGHLEAWRMQVSASGGGQSVTSYITFIPYAGATWRVVGMSPSSVASKYLGRTLSTARSFRPLTDEERESVKATRLRFASARKGEDLAAFGERTGSVWSVSDAAVFNGVFANHRYEGGEMVKIVKVEPYVPKPPPPPEAKPEPEPEPEPEPAGPGS